MLSFNTGFHFMNLSIRCFSKFAWTNPTVLNACEVIVQMDLDKEIHGVSMNDFMTEAPCLTFLEMHQAASNNFKLVSKKINEQ